MNHLIGEKIYLRNITDEDTDNIIEWRNKKHVVNNFIMRTPLTKEMHENWLNTVILSGKAVQFIIVIKENDKNIGSVYIRDIDKENKTGEFGIFIGDEESLGKGYGIESQRLIMQYAYETLGLERLYLRVLEDNKSAIKMYEKNGFKFMAGKEEILDLEEAKETKILFMEAKRI